MGNVDFRPRWSPVERWVIAELLGAHQRIGNAQSLEFDDGDDLTMAALLSPGGRTYMCLIKSAAGLEVFLHEEPVPVWSGISLGAYMVALEENKRAVSGPQVMGEVG